MHYVHTMDMEKITKLHFAPVLRCYRAKTDFSMHQIAHRIGVSKGFYSKLESGERWPNVDMLIRVAFALEIKPGDLVEALVEEWRKAGGQLYL